MRILRLTGHQLKLMLRNRLAILALISAPLLLTYLFSMPSEGSRIALYVADADMTDGSQQLIARLEQDRKLKIQDGTEDRVRHKVETVPGAAGLVLPPGFGAGLASGEALRAQVLQGPGSTAGREAAERIAQAVNGIRSEARGEWETGQPPQGTASLTEDGSRKEASGRKLDGFLVMFLWFVVIQSHRTLMDERENGLTARIHGLPIPYGLYLLAKLLAAYVFGLVTIGGALLAGSAILGIPIRPYMLWAAPVWMAYLLLLSGIVLLIVPCVKNHQSFTILGSVLMALSGLFGGSFFPVGSSAPMWIRTASKAMPGTWVLRSLNGIRTAGGWTGASGATCLTLAALGTAVCAASMLLVRNGSQSGKEG
jgi:ABC-2 type transport system permease protein